MRGTILFQADNAAVETPEGHKLLQGVTLSIRQGEWAAIGGLNGSGKSTLAKLIAGVIRESAGLVRFGSEAVFWLLQQNPESQIVGETIGDDLWFGMENAGVDRAEMPRLAADALAAVGLRKGLEQRTAALSGGEKQLLGIAGCLAVRAGAIVFDEATSMLDPAGRRRVLDAAMSFHRCGGTVVWITQQTDELALSDRIVWITEGRVGFDGDGEAFFYGDGVEKAACERFGIRAPYAVAVARRLLADGIRLPFYPRTADELAKAVAACRSGWSR